ncbi:MAG: glutamate 5-kinase [Lentisphaerae bacterium]|nr:glutamate 5-kinase [Lentisphaerota bacterium]MCP4101811.1 glutamate 5-kinase [Lentisphaerota bacterium]
MNTDSVNKRKQIIRECKRVVVKVGTRLLTDTHRIPVLIKGISKLRERGIEVILVSSGAVGIGMKELEMKKRPRKLSQIQALAATGQNKLMAIYDKECRHHGFMSAQLLLTTADLQARERHLNVLNCIDELLKKDILPIVNENDSVSIDELKFGDNDGLAALLAAMTRSNLTIILTTESGLREKNDGVLGDRISLVSRITEEMRLTASGTDNAEFSIGGMSSKLNAAKIVNSAGEYLWIADGRENNTIEKIIAGEDVGTLFIPGKRQMQARKRWIKFFSNTKGAITVDDGAAEAIRKGGRSLLPSGVLGVTGKFKRGDTLEILDTKRQIIARGLSNFNNEDCEDIIGLQSKDISSALHRDADDVIIHRNNLVLIGVN